MGAMQIHELTHLVQLHEALLQLHDCIPPLPDLGQRVQYLRGARRRKSIYFLRYLLRGRARKAGGSARQGLVLILPSGPGKGPCPPRAAAQRSRPTHVAAALL